MWQGLGNNPQTPSYILLTCAVGQKLCCLIILLRIKRIYLKVNLFIT